MCYLVSGGVPPSTPINIPVEARRAIEATCPGFLSDPWRFEAAEYGTAAQLRRLKVEGRIP